MKRSAFLLGGIVIVALAATAFVLKSPAAGKPPRISLGQEIKLADHLVPGKTVIFDFYSDYCPPCVAMSPDLDRLHARQGQFVVVKVDINRPGTRGIDWQSPVAAQFKLQSIPHFKVFGPDGRLLAEDTLNNSPARTLVDGWIAAR